MHRRRPTGLTIIANPPRSSTTKTKRLKRSMAKPTLRSKGICWPSNVTDQLTGRTMNMKKKRRRKSWYQPHFHHHHHHLHQFHLHLLRLCLRVCIFCFLYLIFMVHFFILKNRWRSHWRGSQKKIRKDWSDEEKAHRQTWLERINVWYM